MQGAFILQGPTVGSLVEVRLLYRRVQTIPLWGRFWTITVDLLYIHISIYTYVSIPKCIWLHYRKLKLDQLFGCDQRAQEA